VRIISTVALASVALFLASSAGAVTLYNNNFDTENGGAGATRLNIGGIGGGSLTGLTVTLGSVDLVRTPDFGITCAGGSGSCLDLDGSTLQAGEVTSGFYAFNAGDTVTFSFDLSGNQRRTANDQFYAGFVFGGFTLLSSYNLGGAWGPVNVLNNHTTTGLSTASSITSNSFANYSINFVAGQAGTVAFKLGGGIGDNVGPVADNLRLDLNGSVVPESATWAMMILGFGAAGSMIRRRKALTA
jgi:hypothetical protein